MIFQKEVILELTKLWKRFVRDYIEQLANRMLNTGVNRVKHALLKQCHQTKDITKSKSITRVYHLEGFNKYILVITDHFTKQVEEFPLTNFSKKTVVNVFVSQVISRYGVPSEIQTRYDQSCNFDSKFVKSLAQVLGVRKIRTTPLHPASNRQVEKQHQTILTRSLRYEAYIPHDFLSTSAA